MKWGLASELASATHFELRSVVVTISKSAK
jgi:hypothetical protein